MKNVRDKIVTGKKLSRDATVKLKLESLPISFSLFFRFPFVFQRPTNCMAFRKAKVLAFLCLILTAVTLVVVQMSGILNVKVTIRRFLHAPKEMLPVTTTTVKVNSVLNASQVKLNAQLKGSIQVSGKLPTYPSPKSTFCPK